MFTLYVVTCVFFSTLEKCRSPICAPFTPQRWYDVRFAAVQKAAACLHFAKLHSMALHHIALFCCVMNEVSLCCTSNKIEKKKKTEMCIILLLAGAATMLACMVKFCILQYRLVGTKPNVKWNGSKLISLRLSLLYKPCSKQTLNMKHVIC